MTLFVILLRHLAGETVFDANTDFHLSALAKSFRKIIYRSLIFMTSPFSLLSHHIQIMELFFRLCCKYIFIYISTLSSTLQYCETFVHFFIFIQKFVGNMFAKPQNLKHRSILIRLKNFYFWDVPIWRMRDKYSMDFLCVSWFM